MLMSPSLNEYTHFLLIFFSFTELLTFHLVPSSILSTPACINDKHNMANCQEFIKEIYKNCYFFPIYYSFRIFLSSLSYKYNEYESISSALTCVSLISLIIFLISPLSSRCAVGRSKSSCTDDGII